MSPSSPSSQDFKTFSEALAYVHVRQSIMDML